jgi:hypothetical protein
VSDHEYSAEFFDRHAGRALSSARAIVPSVLDIVRPNSVVDVGCGIGAWLSVFREHGIEDVLGIDGDYVHRSQLLIPQHCFRSHDLEQPIALPRRFDLAVSLEVAEHIAPASADAFVQSLVGLASTVLFSAAIPGQGGEHHVNEQWPEFWAKKFERAGFMAIDCVRPRVWTDTSVEWWYSQNTFLYVDRTLLQGNARLQVEATAAHTPFAPVVHPGQFKAVVWRADALAAVHDLLDVVPVGAAIILVDDHNLSDGALRAWRMRRLMEYDGVYQGPPASSEAALRDLEKHRREGSSFLVIAFPAFWWLQHYVELADYLRSSSACVLDNGRVVVFDLSREPQRSAG